MRSNSSTVLLTQKALLKPLEVGWGDVIILCKIKIYALNEKISAKIVNWLFFRKEYAAQNLSCMRKLAMQIVKSHTDKRSIKKHLFHAALSQDYLLEMLRSAKF